MLSSVIGHPYFSVYLMYCFLLIVLGFSITALGPMFPYMAASEGRFQTEYSFLFISRALGYLAGAILVKYMEKKFSFHQSLSIGSFLAGFSLIFFSFTTNLLIRGLFIFIGSIGCGFIDVFANICTVQCFKKDNLSTWMQALHGAFGIGGLVGPLLVYLFQLKTMILIGLLFFIFIPLLYYFPSPEVKTQNPENKSLQENLADSQEKPFIPNYLNYLIAVIFLFVVGQQCTYGGWVSSYAVLEGFSTKEHATSYSSVYWISCTFFRFFFAIVKGKPSQKLTYLFVVAIVNTLVSSILIYHYNSEFGLLFSAIVYGMSNSVMFPLLFILPDQFGYTQTAGQNSNFMIFASLGEGSMTMFVGLFMKYLSYKSFIYSMGMQNLLGFFMLLMTISYLKKDQSQKNIQQKSKEIELTNLK